MSQWFRGLTEVPESLSHSLLVNKWLRRYRLWRMIALTLIMVLVIHATHKYYTSSKDHFVKLLFSGEIFDMEAVRRAGKLLDDPSVKGLLIVANSPGGMPVVSEAWHLLFNRLQQKKIPVIAITEAVCASGCYLAIMGVDKIFSYHNSILGSIGAISIAPNFYNIIKKIDIQYDIVKSGPLKGEPHPFSMPNEVYHDEVQYIVNSIGTWFQQQVIKSRGLTAELSIQDVLKKGGIYLAEEALKLKLIDEISDEVMAMEYLRSVAKNSNIAFETFNPHNHSFLSLQNWRCILASVQSYLPEIMLH